MHSLGVGHACRSAVASRDARRGVAAPPRATYWAQPVCVELCIHLQVLSDDKKRAIYDQFGEAGLKGGLGGGAGGPGGVEFTNPFDLFESFLAPWAAGAAPRCSPATGDLVAPFLSFLSERWVGFSFVPFVGVFLAPAHEGVQPSRHHTPAARTAVHAHTTREEKRQMHSAAAFSSSSSSGRASSRPATSHVRRGGAAPVPVRPQRHVQPGAAFSARSRRVAVVRAQAQSEDYYSLLGVDKGASDKQLKAAYRKAAKAFHPVSAPGEALHSQLLRAAAQKAAWGCRREGSRRPGRPRTQPARDRARVAASCRDASCCVAAIVAPEGASMDASTHRAGRNRRVLCCVLRRM